MKLKRSRLVRYLVLILGLVMSFTLTRGVWRLYRAGDRVEVAELQLKELEAENARLRQQRDYYQSQEFIEQQARDKLNMGKEGETVVILPENVGELLDSPTKVRVEEIPVWRQWVNLFF